MGGIADVLALDVVRPPRESAQWAGATFRRRERAPQPRGMARLEQYSRSRRRVFQIPVTMPGVAPARRLRRR